MIGAQAAQFVALPAALEVADQQPRHRAVKRGERKIGPQRERPIVIGERLWQPADLLIHRSAKIVQLGVIVAQAPRRFEALQRASGLVQLLVRPPEQQLRLVGRLAARDGVSGKRTRRAVILSLQQRFERLPERHRRPRLRPARALGPHRAPRPQQKLAE